MEVRQVSQQNTKGKAILNTVTTALVTGAVASEAQRLTMPVEVRAAIKNTTGGVDAFVKKSVKAAAKTIENLNKENVVDSAFKINNKKDFIKGIDLKEIAEKAKNIYPEMEKVANAATKKLNKTFIGVSGIALAGLIVAGLIQKGKAEKAEKAQ